ncbi:ABC transporter substrate-binding protein [Paracoccus aminophilus]|uniref:ABC-type dipeptide transport system, extracellular solute-binding protein n=1 Tax=Paracoccus aminophilus JCM 7686 TaxID=1367847 RepID=S5XZI9_PARAH|nr:ABC transporter substrate-binding protein [Paracoccus aminophilus]AGT10707.1 ABC-type dipeptide transport system, extracellular solute-binding protein [Paracoccus aminophilus JCM 7686]
MASSSTFSRALGVAFAALIAGAAPVLAADDPAAIIRIGSLYEPQNLDNTAGAGQGINEAFNDNVYEALYRLNDDGSVAPALAAEHSVSADGLTHTFKLQPNVKFHSGAALTSADVKYSIERVVAEASKSSRKKSLAGIEAIETPDDLTVVIKLKAKSISLPYNLSYVWIVSDKAGDITGKEDGTGPYKLADWKRGSALSLEAFDAYWGAKPANGGATFSYFTDASALNNALLTNAVDVITSVQSPDALALFEDPTAFTIAEGKSTTKEIMAYNDRVAPFNDVKVRKALARAVDKKKLLEAIWGDRGTVLGSFVPPTDPWYEDLTSVDAYDPASAKELLKEAGFEKGFAFTLETPNYDPHPIVAEFLKAELAKVGVTVNIHVITANEWYTKVYQAKDFQATLQEHVNHRDIVFYGNPDFYWGYDNPKVTELINAAETSDTDEEQAAKLREANKLIAEDAASNWLYLYPQLVVSSTKVAHYPVNGLNAQFFLRGITKSE